MMTPLRLVLIDDDPDLRKLVKLTLEFTAGWEVHAAADGLAGIRMVREQRPDVVLVDVMMPGVDGYEVCRRLKAEEETASIPLILLTARRELDEEALQGCGAAGVVPKPFDPDQLAERVRDLCEGVDRS